MPEQLVESINDTARMARAMLSLLLVAALFVVLILFFSTDENLFRNISVELPQIGIGISIQQGYIFAPLIFLYLHIQMLYLLNVLARKMRSFGERDPAERQRHFDELSAFAFIQLYRHQYREGQHFPSFLPWFLIWFGVVAIPLVLLFAMDLSFVRFQSDKITTGHHIVFFIDLVFVVWFVWAVLPNCEESGVVSPVIQAVPDIMIVSTTFTAIIMVFFLFLSVHPPRFDPETVKEDRECIWRNDVKEDSDVAERETCPNYIDRKLCKSVGICRYLHLRNKWLARTQSVDLAGLILDELGDENVESSRRSVNDIHVTDRNFRFAVFRDAKLYGVNFSRARLEGADFGFAKLHSAIFKEAQLHNTNFRRSESKGSEFDQSKSQSADFSFSSLQRASFNSAELQGSDFKDAKLTGAFFREKAELQGVNFKDARLYVTDFEEAELQGANFEGAKLSGAVLHKAKLQGANFSRAQLDGVDLGEAQLQGSFYEKEFGSWKLAWMPSVSFTFCCAEQYNEMIQEILKKDSLKNDSAVKLAWKKKERMFIWNKDNRKCEKKKRDVQHISLEDHLCDYLMPSIENTGRTKLDCNRFPLKKKNMSAIICYEGDAAPDSLSDERYQNYWTEELAVWASKLACKDSYTAGRIFSRWRGSILSNPHKFNPHQNEMLSHKIQKLSHKIRKVGRNILDCKRENGNRTCPGLKSIPGGKWSRLWTDFDDDLPESSCTKPSSSS